MMFPFQRFGRPFDAPRSSPSGQEFVDFIDSKAPYGKGITAAGTALFLFAAWVDVGVSR
jgi:hypothetical protein